MLEQFLVSLSLLVKKTSDGLGQVVCQQRGDSIPDHLESLAGIGDEPVTVREGLQSCGLSDANGASLAGVIVDVGISIDREMGDHGVTWLITPQLGPLGVEFIPGIGGDTGLPDRSMLLGVWIPAMLC